MSSFNDIVSQFKLSIPPHYLDSFKLYLHTFHSISHSYTLSEFFNTIPSHYLNFFTLYLIPSHYLHYISFLHTIHTKPLSFTL